MTSEENLQCAAFEGASQRVERGFSELSLVGPTFFHGGKRLKEMVSKGARTRPLISVITVVYNGTSQLRSTIESVLMQKRDDLEYIVVDGGSTDGTRDVLLSFDSELDYWISESDAGIYDAMNKAINIALGEFIYHLNIGDILLCIPKLFDKPVPKDVICIAGVVQTSANGLHIPSAGMGLCFHNTLHHQGTFYRLTAAMQYDTRYKVFADFDLNQRLLRKKGGVLLSPEVVAIHSAGGVSHTTDRFFEIYQIVRENYGPLWVAVSFCYFKLRGLRKRLQLLWT